MGRSKTKRLLTETDLANLPDDSYRHELVAGVIVAEPLPRHRHDRTRRRLERLLEDFGEAGYVLARDPDTVRGPDLSFVSAERLGDFDDARFFSGATCFRGWRSRSKQYSRAN